MTAHPLLYVALVVVSGVLSAVVASLAWRNRDLDGAAPLAVLMGAVTVWAAAKVAELVAVGVSGSVFWSNVQYLAIPVVPAAWLVFALQYTGREEWLTRRTLAALAVEPILVLVVAWTNPAHGLFRTSVDLVQRGAFTTLSPTFGPAFWAHATYSYLLLAAATWLLVRMALVSDHLYRSQAVGLVATVTIPWLTNGIYLLGLVPQDLDPTIVGLAASGLILLWTISRHRLLALVPAAREVARAALIERMSDAVVVVDDDGRIVDCNPAAERMLDCAVPAAIGRPLDEAHPGLHEAVYDPQVGDGEDVRTEFSTWDGDAYRHYDVRVSPLRRGRGLLAGRLISIRDVTEQRQREQRLDVLNRLLRHNLRNELNIVLGHASGLAGELEEDDQRRRSETIAEAAERMTERAEKVTRAASRSNVAGQGPTDVAAAVDEIASAKRREYAHAEITTEGPAQAWTLAGPAVRTAIGEVVTNAIRHSDGADPSVHVAVSNGTASADGEVRVRVVDAGPGIPEDELAPIRRGEETQLTHGTGVGLWLVTWVVRQAGGDVEFGEQDGNTAVTVHLPGLDDEHPDRS